MAFLASDEEFFLVPVWKSPPDEDADLDGILNRDDPAPYNFFARIDQDSDGLADYLDPDQDGDGVDDKTWLVVAGVNTAGGQSSARFKLYAPFADELLNLNFINGINGWQHKWDSNILEWMDSSIDHQPYVDVVLGFLAEDESVNTYTEFVQYFYYIGQLSVPLEGGDRYPSDSTRS